MREFDPSEISVRLCGNGFCVDSRELYVWDVDAREAASLAAELLEARLSIGAPPTGV